MTPQQRIDEIKNETVKGANTAERIGIALDGMYPKILTEYPTISPDKAGQFFYYAGNLWHYMTQEELNSIGWNGIAEVGFPAPVIKNTNLFVLYNGIIDFESRSTINVRTLNNKTFILDFLGLGLPNLFVNIPSLSTGPGAEFNVTIKNAKLLKNLQDIGTTRAFKLSYSTISASELNQFFTDLPATTKTATLDVTNNTGSATCNPSIATSKGYTVIV